MLPARRGPGSPTSTVAKKLNRGRDTVGKEIVAGVLDPSHQPDQRRGGEVHHASGDASVRCAPRPRRRARVHRRPAVVPRGLPMLDRFEQPRPVGPRRELAVLFRREARADEVVHLSRLVDGGYHAVAGAGERAGAVNDILPASAKPPSVTFGIHRLSGTGVRCSSACFRRS